jgi:hypothetical protein
MRLLKRASMAVAPLAVVGGLLVLPASAAAQTAGDWPQFSTCPVDNPSMLASPAGSNTACVELNASPAGCAHCGPEYAMKIGNVVLNPGIKDEFGAFGANESSLSVAPASTALSSPAAVNLSSLASVQSAVFLACGAVLGPNGIEFGTCQSLANELTTGGAITATIEPAGAPSDFNLAAATGSGPLLTVPVKIELENGLLGSSCFIGSDAQPIVLNLVSNGLRLYQQDTDPNGYPVTFDFSSGFVADQTFSVPGASGCGANGLLDPVVNALFGLPSGAGNNSYDAGTFLNSASTTAGGAVLSQAFHAALG